VVTDHCWYPGRTVCTSLSTGLQTISAEYNDYGAMDFVRLLASATGGFQAHPVTTCYENQSPVTLLAINRLI